MDGPIRSLRLTGRANGPRANSPCQEEQRVTIAEMSPHLDWGQDSLLALCWVAANRDDHIPNSLRFEVRSLAGRTLVAAILARC